MNEERLIRRIVRAAARSSYGVSAVAGEGALQRLAARLGIDGGGVSVRRGETLSIQVNVHLAAGIPATQVAANVADTVRYHVQREIGRQIDELVVTVDGINPLGTEPAA
jgi:uncharacterized alkaline shock family protein YloU